MKAFACLLVAMAIGSIAFAQTSASYKLTEFALNSGGDPSNATSAGSASFRIRLDAIGDAVVATGLSSASHRMDGGFVGDYVPPGEVKNDRFTTKTTLVWDAEKSVGTYDVYRALLSSLAGLGYGACLQSGLTNESVTDAAIPAAGQGYFYLTTARNRLGEIGTKGQASSGLERGNAAPCP